MNIDITGKTLLRLEYSEFSDDSDSIEKVALCFESERLEISVDEDTDELEFIFMQEPSVGQWKSKPWASQFLGKVVSFSWVANNSQGYQDFFSVALDGPHPSFVLTASASQIDFLKVHPVQVTP